MQPVAPRSLRQESRGIHCLEDSEAWKLGAGYASDGGKDLVAASFMRRRAGIMQMLFLMSSASGPFNECFIIPAIRGVLVVCS